jgi:hypothetical protein
MPPALAGTPELHAVSEVDAVTVYLQDGLPSIGDRCYEQAP